MPGVEIFDIFLGEDGAVRLREHEKSLSAPDLEQEVDFRVHVIRRRHVWSGEEDIPDAAVNVLHARMPQGLDFTQASMQEFAVLGMVLDALEHDPRRAVFDGTEALLDGLRRAWDLVGRRVHRHRARVDADVLEATWP